MIKSKRFFAEFVFGIKNSFEFSDPWHIIGPALIAT
jgi:hypothetical protein